MSVGLLVVLVLVVVDPSGEDTGRGSVQEPERRVRVCGWEVRMGWRVECQVV
jgi:hypothetical protein